MELGEFSNRKLQQKFHSKIIHFFKYKNNNNAFTCYVTYVVHCITFVMIQQSLLWHMIDDQCDVHVAVLLFSSYNTLEDTITH